MAKTVQRRSIAHALAALAWASALGVGCQPARHQSLATTREDVLILLERVTKAEPRGYMTFDFGRSQDAKGVSVVVPEDQAIDLVFSLRPLIAPGWLVFVGTDRWLGDEDHPNQAELVVAPGDDQFDILRIARSDAVNYGMMTEDLVAKLETYDKEVGLDILQANTDTIVARILRHPSDMSAFAEDVYAFCPDIVDQGAGSLDALRYALQTNQLLYLWWD